MYNKLCISSYGYRQDSRHNKYAIIRKNFLIGLLAVLGVVTVIFLFCISFQVSYGAIELNATESGQTSVGTTEFTTYKDNDFGFEIRYPSAWTVNTKDLQYGAAIFNPPNGEVSVIVKVIPRDKHETLKQFGDRFFKKNENFRISEYYRNTNTTFAGLPAIKMIGTYYYNPNIFQQLRGEESYVKRVLWDISLVEKKDAFFGIAYFAPDQSTFDELLPTVQKMINSIKITNLKPQIIEED